MNQDIFINIVAKMNKKMPILFLLTTKFLNTPFFRFFVWIIDNIKDVLFTFYRYGLTRDTYRGEGGRERERERGRGREGEREGERERERGREREREGGRGRERESHQF